jgi:hypothetical protein
MCLALSFKHLIYVLVWAGANPLRFIGNGDDEI